MTEQKSSVKVGPLAVTGSSFEQPGQSADIYLPLVTNCHPFLTADVT